MLSRLVRRLSTAKEAIKKPIQFISISFQNRSLHGSTQFIESPTNLVIEDTLYARLKSPPHLLEAKRLHTLLIVNGLSMHRVLGSQLVSIYVKFCSFEDAVKVFDELPQRSNVAYNAVLRGLVETSQFSDAIDFFDSIIIQRTVPDNFTYPLVFKACSALNALEEGRRVQKIVKLNEVNLGLKPNVFVNCSVIDMFVKCGSLEEARKVFDEMPFKDLACWSAVIAGAVRNWEWFEALHLFNRMRLQGTRPDSVIVAVILPACGALENKQIGTAFQGCANRSGFQNDLYVSNALIDMYCKCGDTTEAHKVFCYMTADKDKVSWTILIAGYFQNCRYHESIKLFLDMKELSGFIRPDAIVASSVFPGLGKLKLLKHGKEMHGYVLKQGLLGLEPADSVLGCAMIDMYMNCGSKREAEIIFKAMAFDNIMMWNSMIVGYSVNGETDLALGMFCSIWGSNLRPNSVTLLSVLPLCTKVGDLRHGKEIHGYAIRSGIEVINVSIRNALMDMYFKCGCFDLGMKIFGQRVEERNVVTYNTLISALGSHGLGEDALLVLNQMEGLGIRPNGVTFTGLLSGCSHAGLVDKGMSLYDAMIHKYKVVPGPEHYSCVVDLLGRAGQIDRAWKFLLRNMPMASDVVNVLGSLLGACRVHNEVEVAELLEKYVLGSEELGLHVLLHNVYATAERWNEALIVRRMIKDKEKRLGKVAGSSWVHQVGGS